MSYRYEVAKNNPLALWMMDDSSPYQDYSGRNAVANVKSGTAANAVAASVVSSALFASVFNRSAQGEFQSPVFVTGREAEPFALEAWLYPIMKSSGYTAQAYRENLHPNPLIQSNLLAGYGTQNSANATVAYTTVEKHVGAGSASVTLLNANVTGAGYAIATTASVPASSQITASIWVKGPTGAAFSVYSRAHNATTGAWISEGAGRVNTTFSGVWQRVVITYVGPTDQAFRPGVQVLATSATVPFVYYMATATIELGNTVGVHFDGTMAGFEWTGAVNGSTSRTVARASRINHVNNPQPTAYHTGSLAKPLGVQNSRWFGGTNGTVPAGTYTIATGTTPVGNSFARKTWTTNTATVGQNGDTGYDLGGASRFFVVPGEKITVSYYMRASSVKNGVVSIYQYSEANTNTRVASPTVNFQPNQWVRVSYTYTVPATNVATLSIAADINSDTSNGATTWAIGDTLDITGVMVERSGTVGSFFDGSTAGGEWSGTVQSSVSMMLVSAAKTQILSNLNSYDGISLNGNVVTFSTSYLNSGTSQVSYDLQYTRAVHVVGIHNANKNELYVNGEQVGEIELTDAQKEDTYTASDTKLYSGLTDSSQEIALNGVAVYQSLSPEQIRSNYIAGRKFFGQERTIAGYGGESLSLTGTNEYVNVVWANRAQFDSAAKTNVAIGAERVTPAFVAGVSQAGSWTVGVPLEAAGVTSVYGVAVDWTGYGITVESSLNGTTWSPVKRGSLVTGINNGFNPASADLQIRVSFAGGKTDDSEFLDNLTVRGYRDNVITKSATRAMTVSYPAVVRGDYEPIEMNENNGIYLNGGALTIAANTDVDPVAVRTIEFWVKNLSASSVSRNFSSSGGAAYVNGTTYKEQPPGEWCLVHVVLAADKTDSIVFSGDIILGQVALYPTALTAQDCADIYASYMGYPKYRLADLSSIAIAEPANSVKAYAYDWAITGAGG